MQCRGKVATYRLNKHPPCPVVFPVILPAGEVIFTADSLLPPNAEETTKKFLDELHYLL